MDRECHADDERVLRDALHRYFPDADGPTLAMKTCLFTNTPDEHFIITRRRLVDHGSRWLFRPRLQVLQCRRRDPG
jgi:hypothetical protein